MNKGNIGQMLKQTQQLQSKMQEVQTELESGQVEGSSGGGMVKVVANGKNESVSVVIDPEAVDKDDVEMLQDLIVAAVNQANEKVQEMRSEKMSGLTGGMNIPGLNLPF